MTVDTHRQWPEITNEEKLTPGVVKGKQVWEKYNCNDCHTIFGFGGYYAPDLTKVYWRLDESTIRTIVKNPDQVYANAPRRMQEVNISDEEVDNLIAFFKWTSEVDNNEWPPQHMKYKEGGD